MSVMCEVLDVSRSGYYSWKNRPLSVRQQADEQLVGRIREIYRKNRKVYGESARIHDVLKDQGIRLGRKRVGAGDAAEYRHRRGAVSTEKMEVGIQDGQSGRQPGAAAVCGESAESDLGRGHVLILDGIRMGAFGDCDGSLFATDCRVVDAWTDDPERLVVDALEMAGCESKPDGPTNSSFGSGESVSEPEFSGKAQRVWDTAEHEPTWQIAGITLWWRVFSGR